MRVNTTILGIVMLFIHVQSSFASICPGCFCFGTTFNDLDREVHDPSRSLEQEFRPKVKVISANPVADQPRPKGSILKRPQNAVVIEKSLKSVSFSPEIDSSLYDNVEVVERRLSPKRLPAITNEVFKDHRNMIYNRVETVGSENIDPIIAGKPYDYQVNSKRTVNEILSESELLPAEIVDLMRINYPGLGNVVISETDLAGLVLFATYHRHPIEFFQTSSLLEFFNVFLAAFPNCLGLIQSMHVNVESYRLTRMAVLNGLFHAAFGNALYYTVEAFFVTFGGSTVDAFIRESIKSGDMKMFLRFYQLRTGISPERLVAWAIKYGKNQVFQAFLKAVKSVPNIKTSFKIPVLVYVAKHQYNLPGIVEMMLSSELFDFDEALYAAIEHGNHWLFKEMIEFGNSFFVRTHDINVLNVLRSIYLEQQQVIELPNEDLLKEVYKNVIKLDSDEVHVLDAFRRALPELIGTDFFNEILQLSMFSKTRNYFKIILQSTNDLNFCFPASNDGIVVCLWDMVKGSKYYKEILIDISNHPSFDILHALGNPDFPAELWPQMLKRFRYQRFVRNLNWSDLIRLFGFNPDVFNPKETVDFELHGKRTWSILDLAILSFNHVAVDQILSSKMNSFSIPLAIDQAKNLRYLISSNDYAATHTMPVFQIKQRIVNDNRLSIRTFMSRKNVM